MRLKMLDIMQFIKNERIKREISSTAIAHAIEVDPSTLYKWENYIHMPKFYETLKILNYLGYEVVIKKKG